MRGPGRPAGGCGWVSSRGSAPSRPSLPVGNFPACPRPRDYLGLSPPPPLDRVVHRFWFLRTRVGAEPAVQTIVPDGRCEIVLHLGEPFAELDAAGQSRPQGRALVAGQLTGPFRLVSRPGADVIGIRLRTGAAHRLLPPQR